MATSLAIASSNEFVVLSSHALAHFSATNQVHSKPLVKTDEDALHAPDANSPRTSSSAGVIDSETMSGIEQAVKGSGLTGDKAASLKQEMIVNAKKTLAELNGAGAVERF